MDVSILTGDGIIHCSQKVYDIIRQVLVPLGKYGRNGSYTTASLSRTCRCRYLRLNSLQSSLADVFSSTGETFTVVILQG